MNGAKHIFIPKSIALGKASRSLACGAEHDGRPLYNRTCMHDKVTPRKRDNPILKVAATGRGSAINPPRFRRFAPCSSGPFGPPTAGV